jgi:ankyrin repeat protein
VLEASCLPSGQRPRPRRCVKPARHGSLRPAQAPAVAHHNLPSRDPRAEAPSACSTWRLEYSPPLHLDALPTQAGGPNPLEKLHAAVAAPTATPRRLRRLLRAAGPTALTYADSAGATLLHAAALAGSAQGIAALLGHAGRGRARRQLLEARREDGATALHLAVYGSGEQFPDAGCTVVELLLKAGAQPGAAEADGTTPLHLACRAGHAKTAALLLLALEVGDARRWRRRRRAGGLCGCICECTGDSSGVPADAADSGGDTPLHVAAGHGQLRCVELLLRHRAGVAAPNAMGNTPLAVAARYNQLACVRALLGARGGARPDVPNSCGHSALDYARAGGHWQAVACMEAWLEAHPEGDSAACRRLARGGCSESRGSWASSWWWHSFCA